MSSTNPSPQESSSDNDLNDLLALLGSESESPSSTIPSIEDSLVQQLDSFEEVNEQQKTTLPPCQVCGGPSSGFHYGAYTCEACKVFFRRAIKQFRVYPCKTNKNLCVPLPNYTFPCKLCRFRKCVEVGMSQKASKMGRYTKERLQQNAVNLIISKEKQEIIPFLPRDSNFHDLFLQCSNIFSCFIDLNYRAEINNFDELFLRVSSIFKQGFYPKEEFHNVVSVTGVEIDNRGLFIDLMDALLERGLKKFLITLRKFPGFEDLDDKLFFTIVHNHLDDIRFFITFAGRIRWVDDSIEFNVDKDHSLIMKRKDFENLSDIDFVNQTKTYCEKLMETNITYEESIFLLSVHMLNPTNNCPHFRVLQNRFLLAFQSYLENIYGDMSDKRLLKLMNLLSLFKEQYHFSHKWILENLSYFKNIKRKPRVWMVIEENEYVKMYKQVLNS